MQISFFHLNKKKMEPPDFDFLTFENTDWPLTLFLFAKTCLDAEILKNKLVSTGIMAW